MKLVWDTCKKLVSGNTSKICMDKGSKMCSSLRLLFVFNILAGHWFAVGALKIRPWTLKYVLSNAVFFISHSVMIAYTYFIAMNSYESFLNHADYKRAYIAVTITMLLGILLVYWRTCCIIVNQSKVKNLVRIVMKSEFINRDNVSKAAKKCIIFLAFYIACYFALLVFGAIMAFQIKKIVYDTRYFIYK